MIALKHLSGLFNYSFEAEPGKNYKGILQEQLKALSQDLQNPVYKYGIQESEDLECPGISRDYLHCKFNFIYIKIRPILKSLGEQNIRI